jgi:hypothetical protein
MENNEFKVAQIKEVKPPKPLKATPHPHQDRLDEHREVPSLTTDRFKNPVIEQHEKECGK